MTGMKNKKDVNKKGERERTKIAFVFVQIMRNRYDATTNNVNDFPPQRLLEREKISVLRMSNCRENLPFKFILRD